MGDVTPPACFPPSLQSAAQNNLHRGASRTLNDGESCHVVILLSREESQAGSHFHFHTWVTSRFWFCAGERSSSELATTNHRWGWDGSGEQDYDKRRHRILPSVCITEHTSCSRLYMKKRCLAVQQVMKLHMQDEKKGSATKLMVELMRCLVPLTSHWDSAVSVHAPDEPLQKFRGPFLCKVNKNSYFSKGSQCGWDQMLSDFHEHLPGCFLSAGVSSD